MSVIDVARQATAQLRMVSAPRRLLPITESFYQPPDPFPPGEPGEIIRAEPMDVYLAPGARLRARAWRVLYHSTSATGEPRAVSGTVLVPRDRGLALRRWHGRNGNGAQVPEARPLVSYAVGTHGIGDAAAPSRLLARGFDWEAGLIAMVLARGWAVAITDYEGLGTPGDHAYAVGRALGCNVLDVMRAARELLPDELPVGGPAAIVGYSEGGMAAGWAAQLQPGYAPEIPLKAVAAGAAAADVETAGPRLERSFFSFFIAYGGIGYAAGYPELDLDPYLTPMAQANIDALRQSNVFQAAMWGPRFVRASDLTQPNVLELPEWRARLVENRLGLIAPEAPVLLHHARRDQIVSFEQSVNLERDWKKLGVDVRLYVTRGGFEHMSGALAGTPVALDWIGRRLGTGAEQPPVETVVEPAAEAA